jgi:hypothetical protein
VWEPAAGEGDMAKVLLKTAGAARVYCSDIVGELGRTQLLINNSHDKLRNACKRPCCHTSKQHSTKGSQIERRRFLSTALPQSFRPAR